MPLNSLKNFLNDHHVRYTTINHPAAYTAQEIAQSAHIAGREVVKTVIVKIDGEMKMVVLPATSKINFDALKNFAHAKKVELASENEFSTRFADCELGAMPPFGNLFGMEVLMAKSLSLNEHIAFNAGSHTELFKLTADDFKQLVKPKVIDTL